MCWIHADALHMCWVHADALDTCWTRVLTRTHPLPSQEVHRTLKPGGAFFATTFMRGALRGVPQAIGVQLSSI